MFLFLKAINIYIYIYIYGPISKSNIYIYIYIYMGLCMCISLFHENSGHCLFVLYFKLKKRTSGNVFLLQIVFNSIWTKYHSTVFDPRNVYAVSYIHQIHIYIYIYVCVCVCVEVNNGNVSDKIEKKSKSNVIQREESNVKESQCYNVSVLMNHHQDLGRMI